MTIKIKYLPHAVGKLTRGSKDAAGWDLQYADHHAARTHIPPRSTALLSTGIQIELPRGKEAQIRPRSGLALKYGVTVLNAPGTIDADFRGEICVILINHGNEFFTVESGDRIAQMVIADVCMDDFEEVNELSDTKRGQGGWGSSGK